jgi:ABC-type glycerol-3-phosphate transport system substrate-binding protein
MSKKLWGLLALLLAFMLVLAACSDGEETTGTDDGTKTEEATPEEGSEEGTEEEAEEPAAEDSEALFPLSVDNE